MASTVSHTNQVGQVNKRPGILQRYRWQEFVLFLIPFFILLLEMFQLILVKADAQASLTIRNLPTISSLIPALGVIAALFGMNLVLSLFFRAADQMLLPLVGLLSGLGVLMATRLGPDINDDALGSRQLLWVLLGITICFATIALLRRTNIELLARYKYTVALIGIVLVGVTLIHSLRTNLNSPTHDELNIGPFGFQPSELLKICIVIFFAAYLSENIFMVSRGNLRISIGNLTLRLPPLRQLIPIVLMLLLSLIIFLGIRELGLALLIYGIFLCMIYLGSGKLSYVIASFAAFFAFGFIGYALLGYVRSRFATVGVNVVNWNPASEALYSQPGGAFQVVQGLIALSSGGILGAGLGLGHPAGPNFVPVVQSDMIFTALGEEFGLSGLFAILSIYLLLIYRGFRIAMDATTTFNQLLAAGLTSIFAVQTVVIIAGNMKFIPLTGLPLPFLSYGGSSILANFMIIGILLRISYNTARERAEMMGT
jgi:cell division protein FtsW (lipid II flippase)